MRIKFDFGESKRITKIKVWSTHAREEWSFNDGFYVKFQDTPFGASNPDSSSDFVNAFKINTDGTSNPLQVTADEWNHFDGQIISSTDDSSYQYATTLVTEGVLTGDVANDTAVYSDRTVDDGTYREYRYENLAHVFTLNRFNLVGRYAYVEIQSSNSSYTSLSQLEFYEEGPRMPATMSIPAELSDVYRAANRIELAARSQTSNYHLVWDDSRLNSWDFNNNYGWWQLSSNSWAQMDMHTPTVITGVKLAGTVPEDPNNNRYVTVMAVQTSDDGTTWTDIPQGSVNTGLTDANHKMGVDIFFDDVLVARFIRFSPVSWVGVPAMRFDVYVHAPTAAQQTLTEQLWDVPEAQRSYSSVFDATTQYSMISSSTGWADGNYGLNGWMLFNLGESYLVSGVATFGRADVNQHTTSIRVEISEDNVNWVTQLDNQPANTNNTTQVDNFFQSPVNAQWVKITVLGFYGYPAMRAGVWAYLP